MPNIVTLAGKYPVIITISLTTVVLLTILSIFGVNEIGGVITPPGPIEIISPSVGMGTVNSAILFTLSEQISDSTTTQSVAKVGGGVTIGFRLLHLYCS